MQNPPTTVPPLPTTPGRRVLPWLTPTNSGLRNQPERVVRGAGRPDDSGLGRPQRSDVQARVVPASDRRAPWAQCPPWPPGGSTARAALSSAGATRRVPVPPWGSYPETHHPKTLHPLRTLSPSPLVELPLKAGGARSGPRVGGVHVPRSRVHGVSLPPPLVAAWMPGGRQSGVWVSRWTSSTLSPVSPRPWVLRRRSWGGDPTVPACGVQPPSPGGRQGCPTVGLHSDPHPRGTHLSPTRRSV